MREVLTMMNYIGQHICEFEIGIHKLFSRISRHGYWKKHNKDGLKEALARSKLA